MIKHLVALNLALAIFGGVGQLEVAMPTLDQDEILDTQRVRVAKENNIDDVEIVEQNIVVATKNVASEEVVVKEKSEPIKVIDHSNQNNAIPHSVKVETETTEEKTIEGLLVKIESAKQKLKSEMEQLLSEPNQVIEIRLDEKNDFGWYFYDQNAEYEPIIYVDMEMIEHWGIDDMQVGETVKGIFDQDGWELYGFVRGDFEDGNNIKQL